jgi:thiosulfate dehydrogenase (quinone) large subunit
MLLPIQASDAAGSARRALHGPAAYLLPLRLFIGVGWLRAFAEKAVDPGWYDGAALARFLSEHLQADSVALPAYAALARELFVPHAAALAWIVAVGQLLVGLGILTGTLTSAALLGGLFMNLNFLLIGRPDPSAFYIVIQSALLLSGSGSVVGLDAWLSRHVRNPLLVAGARPDPSRRPLARRLCLAAGLLSIGVAVVAVWNARDLTPGGSVHDPAMVLAVLATTGAVAAFIAYLQRTEELDGGTAAHRTSPAVRVDARPVVAVAGTSRPLSEWLRIAAAAEPSIGA